MKILVIFILSILICKPVLSEPSDDYFHIGKMVSYDKKFTLYFRTRDKAVLAKGKEFNYITDYPQDLYILYNESGKIKPLITYD